MHTPELLPILAKGRHTSPEKGACLMEYVSIIKGVQFSDFPDGVPQDVSLIGQWANDYATDEERQELIPLINRLASTSFDTLHVGASDLYELYSRFAPYDDLLEIRTISVQTTGRIVVEAQEAKPMVEVALSQASRHEVHVWMKQTLEYVLDNGLFGADTPAPAPTPVTEPAPVKESVSA